MKTIIIILIFLAFFQTSVWPLNLGLIFILSRAFIRQDKYNLILAFGFGLLFSFLEHMNLGLLSLFFLILVELAYLWSKTPLAKNVLTIVPYIAVNIFLVELFLKQQIWPQILGEIILILPTYLLVRFWEERFIVPKEIKLRM